MTSNPDDWSNADWVRHDAALNRLCSAKTDQFARDLDLLGWKIAPQEGTDRWPMIGTKGSTPSWAEPIDPPKPPALRLIDGGKAPPQEDSPDRE